MSFTIKRAHTDDIQALVDWQTEANEKLCKTEMSAAEREIMKYECRQFYSSKLEKGEHIAGLVYLGIEKEPAGCGGISLVTELPSAENPTGKCAYLKNIYIREAFKNQGLEKAVVTWLVFLANERGFRNIYIEASPGSEALYKSFGFKEKGSIMQLVNTDAVFDCNCN